MEQQNIIALVEKNTTDLQKLNFPLFFFFFFPVSFFFPKKGRGGGGGTLSKAAGRIIRKAQGQIIKLSFPNTTVSISMKVHIMK